MAGVTQGVQFEDGGHQPRCRCQHPAQFLNKRLPTPTLLGKRLLAHASLKAVVLCCPLPAQHIAFRMEQQTAAVIGAGKHSKDVEPQDAETLQLGLTAHGRRCRPFYVESVTREWFQGYLL